MREIHHSRPGVLTGTAEFRQDQKIAGARAGDVQQALLLPGETFVVCLQGVIEIRRPDVAEHPMQGIVGRANERMARATDAGWPC